MANPVSTLQDFTTQAPRRKPEQFEFVKRNYMTNPNFPQPNTGAQDLDEYIACIGGGYFFVPPGVEKPGRFLADALLLG